MRLTTIDAIIKTKLDMTERFISAFVLVLIVLLHFISFGKLSLSQDFIHYVH